METPSRRARTSTGTVVLVALSTVLLAAIIGTGVYTVRLANMRSVPTTLADVAIQAQEAALEEDPENVALYLGLADLYYSAKAYDRALDALETLERSDPAPAADLLALSAYGKGKIAYATGDVDAALGAYARSLEITETPEARLAAGALHLELRDHEPAIENLERYVRLVPSNGAALVQLAQAYEGTGDQDAALQAYQRAGALLKDDPEIMAALARLKGNSDD